MKVNIQKEGEEVKQFNLINNWEDVSLETYGKLLDFKEGNKSQEALHLIEAMTDIPKKYAESLALNDVVKILSNLAELQSLEEGVLQHVIRIDGVNYGFHPDLDAITLGEYADIEHFLKDGYIKNFKEIMAVLYRPITSRGNGKYSIEAYDGNMEERTKAINKMSANQVQSALVFFYNFGSELSQTSQSYLMTQLVTKENKAWGEILQNVGHGSE